MQTIEREFRAVAFALLLLLGANPFPAELGPEMDPNGLSLAATMLGPEMDPNGLGRGETMLGPEMDPNG